MLGVLAAPGVVGYPHCPTGRHRLVAAFVAEPTRGQADQQEDYVANDTYKGSFYCVKCKDHRDAEGDVTVNEKGTRIAKAKCPVCGTNLTRFLPKA